MKNDKLKVLTMLCKETTRLIVIAFSLSFLFSLILSLVKKIDFSFFNLFELPVAVTMFLIFPTVLTVIIVRKQRKMILLYPVLAILQYFVTLLIRYHSDTFSIIPKNLLPPLNYWLQYETRLFLIFAVALIISLTVSIYRDIKNEK